MLVANALPELPAFFFFGRILQVQGPAGWASGCGPLLPIQAPGGGAWPGGVPALLSPLAFWLSLVLQPIVTRPAPHPPQALGMNTVLLVAAGALGARIWAYSVRA